MKALIALITLFTTAAFAQGPLTPPGAPAPTMKTLDEIHAVGERRTPISSLPFAISQSGSYYFTGNLTAAGTNGISIDAKNATIDLNGFSMTGSGFVAITVTNATVPTETLVVKNGTITGWQTAIGGNSANIVAGSIEAVHVRDGNGIALGLAKNVSLSRCVLDNGTFPSGINLGSDCTISDCRLTDVHSILCGERANIRDTTMQASNAGITCGAHSILRNCTVTGGGSDAIQTGNTSIVSGCVVNGSFSRGISVQRAGLVENCSVSVQSANFGVTLGEGARITNSTIDGAGVAGSSEGIRGGLGSVTVENVQVIGFSTGIYTGDFSVIRNCKVKDAQFFNISVGNDCKITDCHVANAPAGITTSAQCVVSKNHIRGRTPTSVGIRVSSSGGSTVIEGNEVLSCTTGIDLDLTASNIVFRNTLRGNTTPISAGVGNDVGPVSTAAAATSPAGNLVY